MVTSWLLWRIVQEYLSDYLTPDKKITVSGVKQ
jgi:hypothetical protein